MAYDTYEVGYGKPPKGWQFAAGKSGNPAGRPRKAAAETVSLLDQLLPVIENGEVCHVHPKELALRQQFKLALENDDTAAQLHLLEQAHRHGVLAGPADQDKGGVLVLNERTMPFAMELILATTVGTGPWTPAQIAAARARYCAQRSATEAQIDDAIGYPALPTGEGDA